MVRKVELQNWKNKVLINKKTFQKEKVDNYWQTNDDQIIVIDYTVYIDNPEQPHYIWNFYMTEQELRKLKLQKIDDI